jgi:molybdopterin synthase sulfur carrier subunit
MKIQVRYFASLREALGSSEAVEVPERTTVEGLRELLWARSEAHASALARGRAVRVAVDQAMSDGATELSEGCEVAFFPPVTGG